MQEHWTIERDEVSRHRNPSPAQCSTYPPDGQCKTQPTFDLDDLTMSLVEGSSARAHCPPVYVWWTILLTLGGTFALRVFIPVFQIWGCVYPALSCRYWVPIPTYGEDQVAHWYEVVPIFNETCVDLDPQRRSTVARPSAGRKAGGRKGLRPR